MKDESGGSRAYHTCSGNFFGGPMNPKEKANLTFSCVAKNIVHRDPRGGDVGLVPANRKKADLYYVGVWSLFSRTK